jgi:cytochrome oxidase assembly protein ShyY1
MAAMLPYPIANAYVVATVTAADSAVREARGDVLPVRLAPPPLDEGSHLSYAFQWFAFATIAIAGAAVVHRTNRMRARTTPPPEVASAR